MINTVKLSTDTALGDPRDDKRQPRQRPEGETTSPSPPPGPPSSEPDVRLVIEDDKAKGGLIYRLIDRATGEVVSEVSRDDLVKMGQDPLYRAGRVINTKA